MLRGIRRTSTNSSLAFRLCGCPVPRTEQWPFKASSSEIMKAAGSSLIWLGHERHFLDVLGTSAHAPGVAKWWTCRHFGFVPIVAKVAERVSVKLKFETIELPRRFF